MLALLSKDAHFSSIRTASCFALSLAILHLRPFALIPLLASCLSSVALRPLPLSSSSAAFGSRLDVPSHHLLSFIVSPPSSAVFTVVALTHPLWSHFTYAVEGVLQLFHFILPHIVFCSGLFLHHILGILHIHLHSLSCILDTLEVYIQFLAFVLSLSVFLALALHSGLRVCL